MGQRDRASSDISLSLRIDRDWIDAARGGLSRGSGPRTIPPPPIGPDSLYTNARVPCGMKERYILKVLESM
jgi:hypothetical protein